MGFTYEFPPTEYETTGYRPVLRDAIGDLPEPNDPKFTTIPPSKHDMPNKMDKPSNTIVASTTGGKNAVYINNHDPKPLSDGAIAYLERDPRHLQKHRPPTMQEASSTLPAVLHKGVPYGLFYPDNHDGHLFNNVGCNPTLEHANREADLEKPAPTRTEKDRCDGINPINGHPRRFTVRECLRIMSVPDTYAFPDDMSLSAMYRVTGNGVASRVAYHLAAALAEQILRTIEVIQYDDHSM